MPDFGIRYQKSFFSNLPMQRPDLSSWISCLRYKCCSKRPTDSSHSRTFQELITGIWSCSGESKTAKHYIYTSLFPRFFKPFWSIVAFSLYYLMLIVKPKIAPEAAFKVFPRPPYPHSNGLHYPHIDNPSSTVSEISQNIRNMLLCSS